jgi:hypothetical protein
MTQTIDVQIHGVADEFAGRLPGPGERLALTIQDSLIKEERRTLVWLDQMGTVVPAVIKMYRRHGFVSELRKRIFTYRVKREFEALKHLCSAGIPVSDPLFWGVGRSPDHGRFEILGTKYIPDSVNLQELITQAPGPDYSIPDFEPLAQLVRRMHAAGVWHGALYARNVQCRKEENGWSFHLIDFPRAFLFRHDLGPTHMAHYELLTLFNFLSQAGHQSPWDELGRLYGLDEPALKALILRINRFKWTKTGHYLAWFEVLVRNVAGW